MAIIDPDGLFGGDRLRRCSNAAQLHWPRLFLASDGFARIEINYARIIGRAYPTFNPIPSETELQAWIQEYAKNYLLFLYEADGQLWGQWDTRPELLPRYKTAADRRSPIPPEREFAAWKQSYRLEKKGLPKSFAKISGALQHGDGVGGGVGEGNNPRASDEALVGVVPSIEDRRFETTEPDALFPREHLPKRESRKPYRDVLEQVACSIHARHPNDHGRRDCSVQVIERKLEAIVRHKKVATGAVAEYLRRIDENHRAWCESEDWRKDGGQFVKGLESWLAPTKERYEVAPPTARKEPAPTATTYTKWEPPVAVRNG